MKILGNPQFEKRGDVIINSDINSLLSYKKQKQVNRRLAEIEKRLEQVEAMLLTGVSNGVTKNSE